MKPKPKQKLGKLGNEPPRHMGVLLPPKKKHNRKTTDKMRSGITDTGSDEKQ